MSVFKFEKDLLFNINTESELTKALVAELGMDDAKELLSNLPDYVQRVILAKEESFLY